MKRRFKQQQQQQQQQQQIQLSATNRMEYLHLFWKAQPHPSHCQAVQ
jgi:hypothetical protein